jgi:hypothetical protein
MAAAIAYDAVAIRDRARELGLAAEVDHSPVWGSPFKHVFVFLTKARWEGRLVHISPQNELEAAPESSLIVGVREGIDAEADGTEILDGADELMVWLATKAPAAMPSVEGVDCPDCGQPPERRGREGDGDPCTHPCHDGAQL